MTTASVVVPLRIEPESAARLGIDAALYERVIRAVALPAIAAPLMRQPQEGASDCWAPWRALADAPVVPTKAHLKSTKLFLGSRYGSVGDAREIFQGDGFANQCVAVAINGDVAERLVRAANAAAPASPQHCAICDQPLAKSAQEGCVPSCATMEIERAFTHIFK